RSRPSTWASRSRAPSSPRATATEPPESARVSRLRLAPGQAPDLVGAHSIRPVASRRPFWGSVEERWAEVLWGGAGRRRLGYTVRKLARPRTRRRAHWRQAEKQVRSSLPRTLAHYQHFAHVSGRTTTKTSFLREMQLDLAGMCERRA